MLPWGEPSGYLRKAVLPDARQGVQVRPRLALGRDPGLGPEGPPAWCPGQVQVRARNGPRTDRTRGRVGGHPQERRAALSRVVERRDPGPAGAVPHRAALPHLRWPAAQAGEPRGAGGRQEHRRRGGHVGGPCRRLLRVDSRCVRRGPAVRGSMPTSPARSSRKCATASASSAMSASTTSRWAAAPRRSPAARCSASAWPPRSARGSSACSTFSTSRASACTSATTSGCLAR